MPKQRKVTKKSKQSKTNLWIYIVVALVVSLVIWWIVRPTETDPFNDTADLQPYQEYEDPSDAEDTPPIEADNPLDLAIREAGIKLMIPQNGIRKRVRDGKVLYGLPLDRSKLDLTFANMIVKGQVELKGGQFISGTETGNRQILSFTMEGVAMEHQVEIYFDSSAYEGQVSGKRISIVVDDFGQISGSLLQDFFTVDRAVVFAILPNLPHSEQAMLMAQAQGRETLVHVPMEPIGYPRVDPGQDAILVRMTPSEIERNLSRFLNDLPYCVGVNNHMGSLATADEATMTAVMDVLRERGKYFLDSRTTNVSVAYQVAQKSHVQAYQNKIFLDAPDISEATFQTKLNSLKSMSNSNPNLVAITHCHNRDKLDYLKRFISALKEAGFTLVPLSRLGQHDSPSII